MAAYDEHLACSCSSWQAVTAKRLSGCRERCRKGPCTDFNAIRAVFLDFLLNTKRVNTRGQRQVLLQPLTKDQLYPGLNVVAIGALTDLTRVEGRGSFTIAIFK